jgi:hypothetical protein
MSEESDGLVLPDSLWGTKADNARALRAVTRHVLKQNMEPPVPAGQMLEFENAPDFEVVEYPVKMTMYVPLPWLHLADTDTDELQSVVAPLSPPPVNFEVVVHPGREQQLDSEA